MQGKRSRDDDYVCSDCAWFEHYEGLKRGKCKCKSEDKRIISKSAITWACVKCFVHKDSEEAKNLVKPENAYKSKKRKVKGEVDFSRMDLTHFKRQALRAAKDFNYGKDVENAIRESTTIEETNRIMRKARHEKFG